MNFESLQENYTKVSYRKPLIVESRVLGKSKKVSKFPKTLIKLVVAGIVFYFTMDTTVFASSGIEDKARSIYFDKFIGIAKWVIIGKGGWDIVTRTLKEDFDGAKRSILQYMMIFAVLMGLPWGLGMIEDVFAEGAL